MLKIHHIACLFLLLSSLLKAQFQVKNYYSVTGKKHVGVNVIIQDREGFLLLGTDEGLFRFDGRTAAKFPEKQAFSPAKVTALLEDKTGAVWAGTSSGKIYRIRKNRMDSLPAGNNDRKITAFCETGAAVCAGTYGNGIYIFHQNGTSHITSSDGLSDDVVYQVVSDSAGQLWCGTDGGISGISGLPGKPVFTMLSDKNGLPDNIVRDIRLSGARLLISMQDSGLCFYDPRLKKIDRHPFFTNWTLGTVVNATSIGDNNFFIATEKNGLLRINKGVINVHSYEPLQISAINSLFIDRSGQAWLASKKGISQLSEKRYHFLTHEHGIADNRILALAIDKEKALWAGSPAGIFTLMIDEKGKKVVNELPGLRKVTASCAARAPDGSIWFGTYGSGLIVIDPDIKKFKTISMASGELSNDNISNIFFSGDAVYISTLGGGLLKGRFDLGARSLFSVETTYSEASGLGSNYVYASITDSTGRLFVATDGGGFEMMTDKGEFINLCNRPGYSANTVFSLCLDRYNNIWASSNTDGILRYNGKELARLGRDQGLRDDQPQQLMSAGDLVYAINPRGIDKINCRDLTVSYYDFAEGDFEPNLNAIFYANDRLYSGTNQGILVFRTSQEHLDSVKPTVYIRSLQVNYLPVASDSLAEFRHNQNNISIAFEGIWLKNPDKLSYRYRLQGLEENWIYSNEGKEITYNNLGPGKYTFMFQARNEEDIWSDLSTYSFTILKPLWQRWWFWLLVATALGGAVYIFIRFRLRSLQKENLLLEHRVRERTSEIEKQSMIIEKKNLELEQLSLVASKTDNVVLILDADGRLEYINESFTKLNNITIDELRSRYGHTIYELSNNPDIRSIINEAVSQKRSVSYESMNRKAEAGREIWESSTLTPIFDEQGVLKKIIIIDTDVSERKKQEQIILQKNKDITDSISYASKIQHAILPEDALIRAHLPNAFILYMTKDIVSGDFYWFTHFGNSSIIAAVDCTGHGVPGAFMSLIGYNLLNKIVNEQRITDPKQILYELNAGVVAALHKNESESKDGMDIAICRINHDEQTLQYAGAMRPLWVISNNELVEVKADKIPIGTRPADREAPIAYHTNILALEAGARYFIFTDGYADQFGGEKDKKYSTARFKKLLLDTVHLDYPQQEKAIREEHTRWKGLNEQVDDILIIGFGK